MHPLNVLRNRLGVALPLALLGLVVVSLLVAAAIVTSGSEVMSSSANQRANSALYEADGVMERYVARKAERALTLQDSLSPVANDTRWGFRFDVARLYTRLDTISLDSLAQNQTYSLLARPESGQGRSVGVLVSTSRRAKMFSVNMPAALTVGGNVTIGGNSTISDGRNTGCAPAPNAVQATAGSTIKKEGVNSVIEGKADTASFDKSQLVNRYLGGVTLTQSAANATVKFAAGEFGTSKPSSTDGSGAPRPKSNKLNWGCPSGNACALTLGNEANVAYYPTVAIDAGGGKVTIDNHHGQGILIVHNGSAEFKGNFHFKGIILVERDLVVQGTSSGGGVKIEGAVMALGENSTVADNVSGAAVITYNRCVVETMVNPINIPRVLNAPQLFLTRPHSWFEVVQ